MCKVQTSKIFKERDINLSNTLRGSANIHVMKASANILNSYSGSRLIDKI
jgi:hypothetical protein